MITMNWKNIHVLVTGAGGFIGSHLVEELVCQGARVQAFVRYNSRGDIGLLRFLPADLLHQVCFVFGDLRDPSALETATEGQEYIFHLGALIAIPYSYLHPREVIDTNVIGTLNVLEAARRSSVRRVVHTSTSEVYGTACSIPMKESHPLQGQSPYSASKIGADKIVESYCRAFGSPVVTVRPFNTYGPRQSARAVIPTIITQALSCDMIQLGALDPTRDFTFVQDTVRGFLSAAAAEDVEGATINLGSGAEISIGDLADTVIRLVGRHVPVCCEEQRLRPVRSEVERLHSDNTLARRFLGWQPAVGLSQGLAVTIAWIREHLDLYRVGEYQV